MMGSLLAGCRREPPGTCELYQGRKFKVYRGMGSMARHGRTAARTATSRRTPRSWCPKGVEGRVPYKGPVSDTVYQMLGGLRAGMGYCGAATIDDLRKNGQFIKISGAGLRESHPHDITITKEAPNYSSRK